VHASAAVPNSQHVRRCLSFLVSLCFSKLYTSAFEIVLISNLERFTKEFFFIHVGDFLVTAIKLAENVDLHIKENRNLVIIFQFKALKSEQNSQNIPPVFPLLIQIYRVIRKSLRDFRLLRCSRRDGQAEGEHVNRGRDTPSFCPTLQVLDMSTLGDAADVNPVIKFLPHTASLFVSQRTCRHSARISRTTHELFCP